MFSRRTSPYFESDPTKYRERVNRIFLKYCPENIAHTDFLLKQYAGRETVLLDTMVKKYGPEPDAHEVLAPLPPNASAPRKSLGTVAGSATSPPVTEHDRWAERLRRFYTAYAPDRIGDIEAILETFKGREELMMDNLVKKYGPEPGAPPRERSPSSMNRSVAFAASGGEPPRTDGWYERFARLLAYYDAPRLANLNALMERIRGKEPEAYAKLLAHYGPEPPQANPYPSNPPTGAPVEPPSMPLRPKSGLLGRSASAPGAEDEDDDDSSSQTDKAKGSKTKKKKLVKKKKKKGTKTDTSGDESAKETKAVPANALFISDSMREAMRASGGGKRSPRQAEHPGKGKGNAASDNEKNLVSSSATTNSSTSSVTGEDRDEPYGSHSASLARRTSRKKPSHSDRSHRRQSRRSRHDDSPSGSSSRGSSSNSNHRSSHSYDRHRTDAERRLAREHDKSRDIEQRAIRRGSMVAAREARSRSRHHEDSRGGGGGGGRNRKERSTADENDNDVAARRHWALRQIESTIRHHEPSQMYLVEYLMHAYRQQEEELYLCVNTVNLVPALVWSVIRASAFHRIVPKSPWDVPCCGEKLGNSPGRLSFVVRAALHLVDALGAAPPATTATAITGFGDGNDPPFSSDNKDSIPNTQYSVAVYIHDLEVLRLIAKPTVVDQGSGPGISRSPQLSFGRDASAAPHQPQQTQAAQPSLFSIDFMSGVDNMSRIGAVLVRAIENPMTYVRFRVFQHRGTAGASDSQLHSTQPLFLGEAALQLHPALPSFGQQQLDLFNIPTGVERILPTKSLQNPMALVVGWTFVPDTTLAKYRSLLRRPIITANSSSTTDPTEPEIGENPHGEIMPWEELWDPWGQRLSALFCRYAPQRLNEVKRLRNENKDRLSFLMDELSVKYGPEPDPAELRSRLERVLLHYDRQRLPDCPAYARQGSAFVLQLIESLIRQYGTEPAFRYTVPPIGKEAPHTMTDPFRRRLTKWLVSRCPRRAGEVDYYLRRFAGREEELFSLFADVLGPEPGAEGRLRPSTASQLRDEQTLAAIEAASSGFSAESRRDHLVTPALHNYFAARSAPPFLTWMTQSDPKLVGEDVNRAALLPPQSKGDFPTGVPESGASVPSSASVRHRIRELLSAYAPEKLEEMDSMLQRWSGREEALLSSLTLKYTGPRGADFEGAMRKDNPYGVYMGERRPVMYIDPVDSQSDMRLPSHRSGASSAIGSRPRRQQAGSGHSENASNFPNFETEDIPSLDRTNDVESDRGSYHNTEEFNDGYGGRSGFQRQPVSPRGSGYRGSGVGGDPFASNGVSPSERNTGQEPLVSEPFYIPGDQRRVPDNVGFIAPRGMHYNGRNGPMMFGGGRNIPL